MDTMTCRIRKENGKADILADAKYMRKEVSK